MVAEALLKTVIPSADDSPGIDEVSVLGPSALTTLDRMIAACPERQHLYSHGLLAFNKWAEGRHGCKFPELSEENRVSLFKGAQETSDSWTVEAHPVKKLLRRVRVLTRSRDATVLAVQLYPKLRDDCFRIFYTSRVSWVWLEYDGPPMDDGYPELARRRGGTSDGG